MQLQSKINEIWDAEAGRRILWLPLPLALGIGLYFLLSAEPSLALVGAALAASTLVLLACLKTRFKLPLLVLFLILLGLFAGTLRTQTIDAPILREQLKNVEVSGRLNEKAITEKGYKIIVEVDCIDGLDPRDTPKFASISLRSLTTDPAIGDKVTVIATLYPPPRPAYPGGFDFQRYFYFKQVGAMGFGLPNSLKVEPVEHIGSSFDEWIERLRYDLTQRITASMAAPYGVVAAAFITGDTKGIPAELLENMRTSGIYHLLAVSGMNLVIVSGILFFLARALLALVPYIAVRIHTKKWAAGFALIGTYFYLLIAGSPVSAERAYVMVVLILGAIMLDRQVTPMRSLMLAAIVVLVFQPESLLNASFHLSFGATLGLIAWFELTQEEYKKREGESRWHWKLRFYLEAVLLSSFVAWVSTMPFIIYHFQQVSVFSLPANMICVPLVSAVTMPALIAALLLMPIGLDFIPMKLVEWSLIWVADIANWFAGRNFALLATPPITNLGIALIALGIVWCCIWQTRWRALGLILCVAGFLTMSKFTPPDILIGEEGRQVAFKNGDEWVLAKGIKGMQISQWQEWLGIKEFVMRKNAEGICDRTGCTVPNPAMPVSIVLQRAILSEECREAGLVIAPIKGVRCTNTPTIGYDEVANKGAAAIWLHGSDYEIKYTARANYKRPWNLSAEDEDDEPNASE